MPDATAKIEDLPLASSVENAAIEATQDGSAVKVPLASTTIRAETWVISRSHTSPPSGPSEGDRYIVAASATGTWSGLDGRIVHWMLDGSGAGRWFSKLPAGILYVVAEGIIIVYSGSEWVSLEDMMGSLFDESGAAAAASAAVLASSLQKDQNLSDLDNLDVSLANLGAAKSNDLIALRDATLISKGPVELVANDPDASPTVGLRRLVGAIPTGAWVGKGNQVAEYFADGWHYSGAPKIGQRLRIQDPDELVRFDGTEWVQDFGDVIDIRDFHAVGDGDHDDTDAFAAAAASGRNIYISPSNAEDQPYILSDEITLTNGTRFSGDGHLSYVKQTVVDKNCFIGADDVSFVGLRLEGYGGTSGTDFKKNNGIYAADVKNFRVIGCELVGFEACGVQITGCHDVEIASNYCHGSYWTSFSPGADILVYGTTGGSSRINIHHNLALSRCSEGIAVNVLGSDTDIVINANISISCNDDGSEFEFEDDSAAYVRRHGIQISYNGAAADAPDQRVIVTGNICRNNGWTGIYMNSNPGHTGPYQITGNFISKCAQLAGNTIAGGIVTFAADCVSMIQGNMVTDIPNSGGIVVRDGNAGSRAEVLGNTLTNCFRSIYTDVHTGHVTIGENKIHKPVAGSNAIYCGTAHTETTESGLWIRNNRIERTDAYTAIFVDNGDNTERSFIEGNYIVGLDDATGDSDSNAAIWTAGFTCVTRNNKIKKFKYGIVYRNNLTGGRFAMPLCDYNDFQDCTSGISIYSNDGDSSVALVGNSFNGVTTRVDPLVGFNAGFIGCRCGTKLEIYQAAAPTGGTWAVGDRQINDTPTAGGTIGSVCTTAGAPGTWKTYGAIAA